MKKSTLKPWIGWPLALVSVGLLIFLGLIKDSTAPVAPTQTAPVEHYDGNQPNEPSTWGERYIQDNCERCPACCVEVPEGDYSEGDLLDALP